MASGCFAEREPTRARERQVLPIALRGMWVTLGLHPHSSSMRYENWGYERNIYQEFG